MYGRKTLPVLPFFSLVTDQCALSVYGTDVRRRLLYRCAYRRQSVAALTAVAISLMDKNMATGSGRSPRAPLTSVIGLKPKAE